MMTESKAPEVRPVGTSLGKAQSTRLRQYFEQGGRAMVRVLDGIDLDLAGQLLIEVIPKDHGYSRVQVTPHGIEVLASIRQATIAVRNEHHSLGSRLASYLRQQGRITWENLEFKNLVGDGSAGDLAGNGQLHWEWVRPDVYSILPSTDIKTAYPCVHEVKVSRSDFMRDISNPGKRGSYALLAHAVYYVAPEGIIAPEDLPKGVGLLVERKPGNFALIKRARKNRTELQPHHFLNLIIKTGTRPQEHGEPPC